MRAEDRELEGPDLEREEATRQETAHEEEELPAIGGEAVRDVELESRSTLLDAIRLVMAGEHVTVSLLYLPQRETHALEALQAAVNGQDSVGEFVFAEDRKALLEQSLAVLQENVTHSQPEQLAELHAKFGELSERIGELRHRLVNLEDAQDDLFDEKRQYGEHEGESAGDGDKDDKGEGGQGDKAAAGDKATTGKAGAGAAPARDLSLYEPERPVPSPPSSALYGEASPEQPPAPSTLEGPDRPAEPPRDSALYGEARPEEPPAPSTLEAPERPEEPRPPSTLGADPDPDPRPWWSRPFGRTGG